MLYESILLTRMPGNAREQAGGAREPQYRNLQKSKNSSFFDPPWRHDSHRFSFTFDAHFNNRDQFWACHLIFERGKLSDSTLVRNEFITLQIFSQHSPKGHIFSHFQLAQHWPRITLEPIQEYALRVNITHQNARERPGTSRGSPGTSIQEPSKIQTFIIFRPPVATWFA